MEQRTSGAAPRGAGSARSSAADPIRGVAAVAIDTTLSWHIARTLPRMGARALKALEGAEIATYLPRASEVVVRRGRRVVRRTPLLMRTVFIGVRNDDHLGQARTATGIAEIVSHPEPEDGPTGNIASIVMRPARLDPADLQRFVNALAKGEIVEPMGLKVGQSVLVLDGPFASFPAVVEAILPSDRVKVAVSIFGRPSPVELDIAQVQAV